MRGSKINMKLLTAFLAVVLLAPVQGCTQSQEPEAFDPLALHEILIIIDGAVPLLGQNAMSPDPEHIGWYKEGGFIALSDPPWYFPQGIEDPRKISNLTVGLAGRGYSQEDIAKIMGGNWMQVMDEVWGN